MSRLNRTSVAIGVAGALSALAVVAPWAIAQPFDPWQNSRLMKGMNDYWAPPSNEAKLGKLGSDEVIFVDVTGFDIAKGGAKRDMSAHIDKLHAREVSEGAVIFRSGNKLFIVDGKELASK